MKSLYWIRRSYRQARKQLPPLRTVVVDELPDSPQGGVLYLLGLNQMSWAALLLCPCGCGSLIELNLLPEARPCWRIKEHCDSTISLTPSVARITGCRSHFWVKGGLIEWTRETFRAPSRRRSRRGRK